MTEAPSEFNYFQLFGLAVEFAVDLEALEQSRRHWQNQVHPDKMMHASAQAQAFALKQSAYINQAYRTLKAPLSRARYLLELKGIKINDNSAQLPPEFLMTQMALREKFEQLEAQGADSVSYQTWQLEIDQALEQRYAELQQLLKAASTEALTKAALTFQELQFFARFQQSLQKKHEQLACQML
jgi:molecular chaperone HscB